MSGLYKDCTVECERMPDCATCGQRKGLWPGELARIREYERGESGL